MRMFDAEQQMMADLKDEGHVVEQRAFPDFGVTVVRHPTLGKLVLVEAADGSGAVVEVDE